MPDPYAPLSRELLLDRGVCCGSGCRNCPYEPCHTAGSALVYDLGARDAQWEGWPAPRTEVDACCALIKNS